ncbi:MAG: response regulator [Phycisphaerae bacterium]|nr:response regulator [Phycisphaerae bacterium]
MNEDTTTILLVEGDIGDSGSIRRAFASAGDRYRVETAANLAEARRRLSDSMPDLVIADASLPDGRATDLAASLGRPSPIPLLVLADVQDRQAADEAVAIGASDLVVRSDNALAAMPRIAGRALREWRLEVERRRAEERLSQVTAILERITEVDALGSSQETGRAKIEIGGGAGAEDIARELKHLLIGILGCAGLARLELPEDSPAHQRVVRVEESARRAAHLIDRMLAPDERAAARSESLEPVAAGRLETPAAKETERGTVLIVDDEDTVLDVSRRVLERAGVRVLTAASGREAIETFTAHAGEINAVLLDMSLEDLTGQEVCLRLRRVRRDVKVLLMSGYEERDVVSRFDDQELAGFVQKPFSPQTLVDKLTPVLMT